MSPVRSHSLRITIRRLVCAAVLAGVAFAAAAADLTVSAAASLTDAFRELAPAFEARHPGTKVLLNFGASDALLAQIAKGAPADVFASADEETMDKAAAQNLLAAGTRRDFAANTLVAITPITGAPMGAPGLTSLADLRSPAVKHIALGNPAGVPDGRYARGALEAAGQWAALEPKMVFAQNVRQCLDYVARGEAEAGFVYATDAATQKDKVRVAFSVPTQTPIRYPVAALTSGPNGDAGRQFVEFVASPDGRAVLARYGFSAP